MNPTACAPSRAASWASSTRRMPQILTLTVSATALTTRPQYLEGRTRIGLDNQSLADEKRVIAQAAQSCDIVRRTNAALRNRADARRNVLDQLVEHFEPDRQRSQIPAVDADD